MKSVWLLKKLVETQRLSKKQVEKLFIVICDNNETNGCSTLLYNLIKYNGTKISNDWVKYIHTSWMASEIIELKGTNIIKYMPTDMLNSIFEYSISIYIVENIINNNRWDDLVNDNKLDTINMLYQRHRYGTEMLRKIYDIETDEKTKLLIGKIIHQITDMGY